MGWVCKVQRRKSATTSELRRVIRCVGGVPFRQSPPFRRNSHSLCDSLTHLRSGLPLAVASTSPQPAGPRDVGSCPDSRRTSNRRRRPIFCVANPEHRRLRVRTDFRTQGGVQRSQHVPGSPRIGFPVVGFGPVDEVAVRQSCTRASVVGLAGGAVTAGPSAPVRQNRLMNPSASRCWGSRTAHRNIAAGRPQRHRPAVELVAECRNVVCEGSETAHRVDWSAFEPPNPRKSDAITCLSQ